MRTTEDIFKEVERVPDFYGHRIDSVFYRNGYGDTPLHIVANWGDCEAISVLLSAGADVNAIGESGFTPLHCAAEQNRSGAIILLRKAGASTIGDADGETPLELATSLGNRQAINALRKKI